MPSTLPALDSLSSRSLPPTLWIGGAQWAGKSTIAWLLTARYPLVRYSYDYHDARAHAARARTDPDRYPGSSAFLSLLDRGRDAFWVDLDPPEMAEITRRVWKDRFIMVLDDLAAMPPGVTVVAEGWGFRPELVAPVISSPRQAIYLVPTEEFRQQQLARLPRAGQIEIADLTDRDRAQRHRVERDRLLALEVVERANQLGLRVLQVDGVGGEERVLSVVEEHFKPFLPAWIY